MRRLHLPLQALRALVTCAGFIACASTASATLVFTLEDVTSTRLSIGISGDLSGYSVPSSSADMLHLDLGYGLPGDPMLGMYDYPPSVPFEGNSLQSTGGNASIELISVGFRNNLTNDSYVDGTKIMTWSADAAWLDPAAVRTIDIRWGGSNPWNGTLLGSVTPVPEPSAYAGLAGLVALAVVGLRRRS